MGATMLKVFAMALAVWGCPGCRQGRRKRKQTDPLPALRLPAGRPLIAAAEPSPDLNHKGDYGQREHEMYHRHSHYFARMVLDPFPPGQQSRSRNSDQQFPCRPQPAPESLAHSTTGVPKQMVDDPARDSPMNWSGHPRSVTQRYGMVRIAAASLQPAPQVTMGS